MPPRTRKNDDAEENTTVEGPSFAGTFYEGFDSEEYPDAVSLAPGELVVFDVESQNTVQLEDIKGEMVDVLVAQITIAEGTTATIKEKVGDEYVSTGVVEPIGETRSLWIKAFVLEKSWNAWDPQTGDRGAVKFAGHQKPKRKNAKEYQKWFVKFDKPQPRG